MLPGRSAKAAWLTEIIKPRGEGNRFRKYSVEELFAIIDAMTQPIPMCGCRVWEGTTTKAGYGVLAGKYVHRMVYERERGTIQNGLHVLHVCDVPSCVNPAHMFLGTQQDNNNDKLSKGRAKGGSMKGVSHPSVKLSDDDVRSIREEYKQGLTQVALAKKYGIGQAQVSSIVRREYWKHIN